MDKKKGGCEYFPEIKDCVECEYFREVETEYDIVTKCEMYDIELAKKRKKTFAEWLLNFVKTHPNAYITMEQGFFGEFMMRICDMSKRRPIASKCSLPGIEYEKSKLTIDEIFIHAAEELEKEIENYGK